MDGSNPSQPTAWSGRQAFLFTLFVVGVALAAYLLYSYRAVLALVLLAVILGTAIRPPVDWLQRRVRVPRPLAVLLVYAGLLALLALFVVLIVPPLVVQFSALAGGLPEAYRGLRGVLRESTNDLLRRLGGQMPPFSALGAPTPPAAQTVGAVVQSLAYANAVIQALAAGVVVLLLGYYWALEGPVLRERAMRWFPAQRREGVGDLVDEVEGRLGQYVAAQALLSLVVGTTALVAYIIIGLPYTVLLGVFAGVMEAVPMVGPILGAIPALLVALTTDPSKVIWVVVASVIIQLLENNLLVPRLMSRAVGINPLVTLLALAAFAALFGYLGVLLAVPMAAVIQLVLNRLVLDEGHAEGDGVGRDRLAKLRYEAHELAEDARRLAASAQTPDHAAIERAGDEIQAIAEDLDVLLQRSRVEGGVR